MSLGCRAPDAAGCAVRARQAVNVDGERSLVAVRATGGSADAALGAAHMAAGVAVASFEIEDLLVGARCPAHAYLARSFEAPGARPIRGQPPFPEYMWEAAGCKYGSR